MASTAAANNLQRHRPRPSVAKPIVPAIPLPFIQRRKQHATTAPKSEPELDTSKSARDEASSSPSSSAADRTLVKTELVVDTQTHAPAAAPNNEAAHGAVRAAIEHSARDIEVPRDASSPIDTKTLAETHREVEKQLSQLSSPSRSSHDAQPLVMSPPSPPDHHASAVTTAPLSHPPAVQLPEHQAHSLHAQLPYTIASPATMTPHSAPPPANLMFGAHTDSNNSSPVPTSGHSTSNLNSMQVPGLVTDMSTIQYGTATPQTISNGQSPMAPQGYPGYYTSHEPQVSQGVAADYTRRQLMSFGHPEGFSPSVTPGTDGMRMGYDPTTPHSFHGSQSSVPNEQDFTGQPFYNQYARPTGSNGINGHVEDVRLYHQPRPGKSRAPPTQPMGHHYAHSIPQPPLDNLDGLVGYLQSQFGDPSFADYTLELRYADDRAEPVRIPGHNLLFARSPTLKGLMTAQARDANTDVFTARTLLVESNDRFLRSDAFWLATQRLYGGPLLDHGVPAISAAMTSKLASPMPGTPADRFELALGYAAAGHILQIPPVINRGVEIATQFVNWLTLEKALDFALDGGLDSQQWMPDTREMCSPPTYGPVVNMLLNHCLNFIIGAFPSTFDLDTTTSPPNFHRLPVVVDSRSGLYDPRLSSIRFGDHFTDEPTGASNGSIIATLSRILLELPFPLLKFVLESSRLGNVQGWAAAPLRQKVMSTVIEERERRRAKVRNSKVPNGERTAHHQLWEVVGFEESVRHGEMPILQRKWVGFTTTN